MTFILFSGCLTFEKDCYRTSLMLGQKVGIRQKRNFGQSLTLEGKSESV